MSGAEKVYLDPRVTRTMKDQPEEGLVGYVREDVVQRLSNTIRGQETVVQIMTNPNGNLVGLTNWGRVFALVAEKPNDPPAWKLVADQLEKALDS